jgi:hypothetical protein
VGRYRLPLGAFDTDGDPGDIEAATPREKIIERWRRAWKIALIEAANPQWLDLWESLDAVPEGRLSRFQRH